MHVIVTAIDADTAVVGFGESVALDAMNGDDLRRALADVGGSYARVIVDLAQVTFVDSTALGAFVGLLRRLRQKGGELRLSNARPAVLTILELTRLDNVFPVHASVAEAQTTLTSVEHRP